MLIAGVMTGTSVDAIDVALCEIEQKGNRTVVSLFAFASVLFSESTRSILLDVLGGSFSLEVLSDMQFRLAREYAEAIQDLEQKAGVQAHAVAIHGQTLWHHPPLSTWQAGSGSALSALLERPVVFDFRAADVALGGQGAPLVPIYDLATLLDSGTDRIALNLGGMANVTILTKEATADNLIAFDTGPGNVWIDASARTTFGKRFDEHGAIGRAGRVIQPMLNEMMTMPYFAAEPPKSTGRELFTLAEAKRLMMKYSHPSAPLEDVVTTMTELTAWSIADHVARYAPTCTGIVVSGGGSQNPFLLERIAFQLEGHNCPATLHVHPQWHAKEAMAFAYLGWLTLQGRPGNVPSVTGATRSAVLGAISGHHLL